MFIGSHWAIHVSVYLIQEVHNQTLKASKLKCNIGQKNNEYIYLYAYIYLRNMSLLSFMSNTSTHTQQIYYKQVKLNLN